MKPRNIYFLHWNSNKCFLSNLPEKAELINFLEEENIKGYYGSSPDTEDMLYFQTEGKVKVEMAVRSWYNDSRFLLYFILSIGIFLLSFYFLSYVIRDPLPLVDEIVLSSVFAILGWHRLKNQDVHSEKALLKKQELIQFLNRIPFESAPFLKQVELYLEKVSLMKKTEVDQMLAEGTMPLFFNTYGSEVQDLRKALEGSLKRKKKRKQNKPDYPELKILLSQINNYIKNS